MLDVWISNASPLIVLAKIRRLRLLELLAVDVLVPAAVAEELLAGPTDDPARAAIKSGWGKPVSPTHVPIPLVEYGLGAGETSVLALALEHPGSTAILDDAAARAAARTFGIPTIGTLGILVRAKVRGLIPSAAHVFRDVRLAGLYFDDAVARTALAQVGELWNP